MPRTTLAKTTLLGSYPVTPLTANSADFTFLATTGASGSSGNQIDFGDFRALLVVVQNSDPTNPYNVTFTSRVDNLNRTGDISGYVMQATEFAVFYFERDGWRQSDSMLYCEGTNAAIKMRAFGLH